MGIRATTFPQDLQESPPSATLALTKAGVSRSAKAIRIRGLSGEQLFHAEVACSCDLDPAQKGVHMSRFEESVNEAIDGVVIGEALVIEALAEHIAQAVVERQGALRSEVTIRASYPVEKRTPVTDVPTQEMYGLIGIAAANRRSSRRVVGVTAQGMNACPCAQGLIRAEAEEALRQDGFSEDEVARITELVPMATHNQRARGTLYIGAPESAGVRAEDMLRLVEGGMSSEIYELLKRPDERFVVEKAHRRPRFVEDSVREVLREVTERFPDLPDDAFVRAHQVNFETIHTHDVEAERSGTLGEVRRELEGGPAPAHHTTLEEWLLGRVPRR
jgi:GTP cyclohydrolase I/GTP cyclohydrolase-4